jgi:uncharacterized protein YodC (DUF2158 family)
MHQTQNQNQNQEQDQELKVGDVVKLRSGGPWMTIVKINEGPYPLDCRWFFQHPETNSYIGEIQCSSFPASALTKQTNR